MKRVTVSNMESLLFKNYIYWWKKNVSTMMMFKIIVKVWLPILYPELFAEQVNIISMMFKIKKKFLWQISQKLKR